MNYKSFFSICLILVFFRVQADDVPNSNQLSDDNILPKVEENKNTKTNGILPDISITNLTKKIINNENVSIDTDRNLVSDLQDKKEKKSKRDDKLQSGKSKSDEKKVLVYNADGTEMIVKGNTAHDLSMPNNTLPIQPQPEVDNFDSVNLSQSSVSKIDTDRSSIKIFNENVRFSRGGELEYITLPSGSSATATLLGGVNISTEERSIEVNLDSAFIGPNDAVVELKGCIAWLKLSANYNDERLYGNGQTISCRTSKGNTFEIPILAHVKGEDEYLGVKGALVANGKMKAGALAFIKDGIAGYAEARAKTQTTTSISTSDNVGAMADNVTGNGGNYAINKAIGASADNRFLNWYIDHYSSLAPTIAVPPGTKIFLTIQGEVKVPREFFSQSGIKFNTNAEYLRAQKKE